MSLLALPTSFFHTINFLRGPGSPVDIHAGDEDGTDSVEPVEGGVDGMEPLEDGAVDNIAEPVAGDDMEEQKDPTDIEFLAPLFTTRPELR